MIGLYYNSNFATSCVHGLLHVFEGCLQHQMLIQVDPWHGYSRLRFFVFYIKIARTSAVSSTNFGSILILASCVVGTCNMYHVSEVLNGKVKHEQGCRWGNLVFGGNG